MVKSTAILAFAASAMASFATAEMLHYGSPIEATVWTAGSTGTVSWTNDCADLTNTTFPITLNHQVGTQQVQVPGTGPIGTLDCKSPGSATVQVPATIPQGTTYSILVVNGNEQSYSALFTINSSIPAGGANTTTPSASASASAAPSSTASGTKISLLPTASGTPKPSPVSAGSALKAGSTAALVVVAAVGLML
ncbi:hypothetical protein EC968_001862 [Mortierella alpina]|nr:hypothetical protein EC968_001862 [Mortierella alpina]